MPTKTSSFGICNSRIARSYLFEIGEKRSKSKSVKVFFFAFEVGERIDVEWTLDCSVPKGLIKKDV